MMSMAIPAMRRTCITRLGSACVRSTLCADTCHGSRFGRLLHSGRVSSSDNNSNNQSKAEGAAVSGKEVATVLPKPDRQLELAHAVRSKLEHSESLHEIELSSWDAFFNDAGLLSESSTPADYAMLTLMLSYPLSLAWLIQWQRKTLSKPVKKLQIVGARAEAKLPKWVMHVIANLLRPEEVHIELIGPMVPQLKPKQFKNIHVSYVGAKVYHEAVALSRIKATDVDSFFCFHPGWGQPEWQGTWRPTIEMLLASDTPVYFTSFDDLDQTEDCNFARQQFRRLSKKGGDHRDVIVMKEKHKKNLWSGANPFASKVNIPMDPSKGIVTGDTRLISVNRKVSIIANRNNVGK